MCAFHLSTVTENYMQDKQLVLNAQGAISLQLLGGKLAPELVYFVLKKVLLNFSEIESRFHNTHRYCSLLRIMGVGR